MIANLFKSVFLTIFLGVTTGDLSAQPENCMTVPIQESEYWWGGFSAFGSRMPYSRETRIRSSLIGETGNNQAQPLLISNKGRYIWCEGPFAYAFDGDSIRIESAGEKVVLGGGGHNLKEAFLEVSGTYFPSNGQIPDEYLFTRPQYNTWIELMYDQNEEDILKYAQSIIDNGFSPGVLMIDDNWQEDYGVWEFSASRFNDPKAMIGKLHDMGFKVMLWICPFVSPDCATYRKLAKENVLLLDNEREQNILWANTKNKPAIVRWWNGASACVDLSNPAGEQWFKEQLRHLVEEYGVDGFKFDAGDAPYYAKSISYEPITPNEHTSLFAGIGLDYPLNEYRAAWKMAGLPLVQRLRDKAHEWGDLQKLIPDILAQGLMGYAYTCPDMIGGGEYLSFLNAETIDQELIVRSAQVHALMPMMQFSVAPWRILSDENLAICREMSRLHEQMAPRIVELAKHASLTGEPIVRHMAYEFADQNFELVNDQFMLGSDILVAPVIEKGARSRTVLLPKGVWVSDRGEKFKGGQTIRINVPLERLPYFKRLK